MTNLKDRGLGTITDVLFLTLTITFACLLIIGSYPNRNKIDSSNYARRVAQNTLLILQHVSAGELGDFHYTPNLQSRKLSERTIKRKTATQLITEDVLLNPKWRINQEIFSDETNYEYGEKLEGFLENSLEKILGDKFGYRLIIKMNPVEISENRILEYQRLVEDYDMNSKRICSESIDLNLAIPQNWLGNKSKNTQDKYLDLVETLFGISNLKKPKDRTRNSPNALKFSPGGVESLTLTLEIWSK